MKDENFKEKPSYLKLKRSLEVMTPKASPYELIRIGGDRDGAYLVPNDLEGVDACFSPGVNNSKLFEDDLFHRFGIKSHMCDYSSDVNHFKSPLLKGQTFLKKWLDVNEDEHSISLEEWVKLREPNEKGEMILQMDIEGAEFRNFSSYSDELLRKFRIILIEIHQLGKVNNIKVFNNQHSPLLEKIGNSFVCVHAHPNNCCGDVLVPGSKRNMPRTIELTFLRKDRFLGENRIQPMIPHPLDINFNVRKNKPIFLNPEWNGCKSISIESRIKKLEIKLNYLKWLKKSSDSV